MILKNASAALFGAAVLACGSAAADSYQPGEYFSLGLAQAVLSPKPLGPSAQFHRIAVQAKAEPVKAGPTWAPDIKHVHTVRVTRERS